MGGGPQIHRRALAALVLVATAATGLGTAAVPPSTAAASRVSFRHVLIDAGLPGTIDNKAVGDLDGDSLPDVIVGTDTELIWYKAPAWTKAVIAPGANFSTDMQVGDVDGDSDLDIVTPEYDTETIEWFRNPLVGGGAWTAVPIGTGLTAHDLEVGDVDGDGRLDVVTRAHEGATTLFRQASPASWDMTVITAAPASEGTALADLDGDGRLDIVQNGYWLRAPPDVTDGDAWTKYGFEASWETGDVGVAVGDLNGDGRLDVALARSENVGRMAWYEAPPDPRAETWTEHPIDESVDFVHTFKLADIDKDGDRDVVFAEMAQSAQRRVGLYLNGGAGLNWATQVLSSDGSQNIRVADIGNDGDLDVVGANWQGAPVELWENEGTGTGVEGPLDRWAYKRVTASHQQTFGLAFGDIDRDDRADIVSGPYWYKNPGGDMSGKWAQSPSLPSGIHAVLVTDVDGDLLADVIGVSDSGRAVSWLEATTPEAGAWTTTPIGVLPASSHELGMQGYRLAQVEAGGRPEVVLSSGGGLYYFRVPGADAAAGNWPLVHVTSNAYDEGVGAGDIDGDGDVDLVAGTAGLDVNWYRNPGNGKDGWTTFTVGTLAEADGFPDRFEVGDVDGDGLADIVTGAENGAADGAATTWWRRPADPTAPGWVPHVIALQGSTNSMDVADLDGDSDLDVATGEHRGALTVAVWENDGHGAFTRHVVDQGKESHLGARLFDLDGDADLDLVSIAYDLPDQLHLWRNDGGPPGGGRRRADLGDYDGDGSTDVAVYRPSSGQWFVRNVSAASWGLATDVPVPGDFDGDGLTDLTVYRPSTGQWFISGGATTTWGLSTDVPVPGDYDGDGTTDVAVYRPSTGQWFVRGGATATWGLSTDVPVPGDFDGDGATDVAVYRPASGQWFVRGGGVSTWGAEDDVPVAGDYDGDGATDVAVYRPASGQWFVGGGGAQTTNWGGPSDVPVAGDYDGNGSEDIAVYRPSTGQWFVRGGVTASWGLSSDIPLR